ncbi:MAG TPA: hypothetical protein VFB43_07000 [Terracidiphilus sp.]|nr:hypothetical protein [Terracidiphilus sp.]
MKRTLHDHIVYLEQTVQSLRDQLTRPTLTSTKLETVHTELKTAELALAHYRKAHELEQKIGGAAPTPSTPHPRDSAPSGDNHDDKTNTDRCASRHRRLPLVARAAQTRTLFIPYHKRPRRMPIVRGPMKRAVR